MVSHASTSHDDSFDPFVSAEGGRKSGIKQGGRWGPYRQARLAPGGRQNCLQHEPAMARPVGPWPATSPTPNPRLDRLVAVASRPAVVDPTVVAPPATPSVSDVPSPAIPSVAGAASSGTCKPAVTQPPLPADGL